MLIYVYASFTTTLQVKFQMEPATTPFTPEPISCFPLLGAQKLLVDGKPTRQCGVFCALCTCTSRGVSYGHSGREQANTIPFGGICLPFFDGFQLLSFFVFCKAEQKNRRGVLISQFSSPLPFSFEGRELRGLHNDAGEPLFVAKDVALAGGDTWKGIFTVNHIPKQTTRYEFYQCHIRRANWSFTKLYYYIIQLFLY